MLAVDSAVWAVDRVVLAVDSAVWAVDRVVLCWLLTVLYGLLTVLCYVGC